MAAGGIRMVAVAGSIPAALGDTQRAGRAAGDVTAPRSSCEMTEEVEAAVGSVGDQTTESFPSAAVLRGGCYSAVVPARRRPWLPSSG